jgi:hypothetical protein
MDIAQLLAYEHVVFADPGSDGTKFLIVRTEDYMHLDVDDAVKAIWLKLKDGTFRSNALLETRVRHRQHVKLVPQYRKKVCERELRPCIQ